jgi:hypothetical protein
MTRSPLWKNPRILSTLLFVFLSGAVAGAITMRMGVKPERHRVGPYWNEGGKEGKEAFLKKFKKELDLTPQQATDIEQILDDFMTYYQMLDAQMTDVRATGKKRILRLLNDEQKAKFERMMNDARASR